MLALAALGIAQSQLGVPYRYGGTAPTTGFDCSGLTVYSYAAAGLTLPRTARAQRAAATPVKRHELAPGDLVFFRLGRSEEHVGLYAGDGVFIHAPSSGGAVRRDRMGDPYWVRRYLGAGRVPGP